MNVLIEEWRKGATKIYESETNLLKYLNMTEEERTFTYKYLAQRQINLLEETKPFKTKKLTDQMNEQQKECYEYLKKVVETGEL